MIYIVFIVKYLTISTSCYCLFKRIMLQQDKFKEIILNLFIFDALLIITRFMLQSYFLEPFVTLVTILFSSIYLACFTKCNIFDAINYTIIAYAFVSTIYFNANIITFILLYQFANEISINIINLVATLFYIIAYFTLLKLKSIQNIVKLQKGKYIIKTSTVPCLIIILVCSLLSEPYDAKNSSKHWYLLLLFALCIVSIIVWLFEKLCIHKENVKLQEINKELSREIHRSREIIPSVNRQLEFLQQNSLEFSEELSIVLKEMNRLNEDQLTDTQKIVLANKELPSTGLKLLDSQLHNYLSEATSKNIDFNIIVRSQISNIVENNTISQTQLQRLIGDHVRNAFNAIKNIETNYKELMIVMGLTNENIYQIEFYDSGKDFNIDTLIRLGERGVTINGTGNGFADTFETIKECSASLLIEEFEPEDYCYTKCISIIWDNKNQYNIKSYRADSILSSNYNQNINITMI
ncbi:MAG: hypothetical protein WAX04_06895 [Oscillospiraceae bacterium]